ncbi:MAG: hypothetical protein ABR521_14800 [Gaiellaceae bacterium]
MHQAADPEAPPDAAPPPPEGPAAGAPDPDRFGFRVALMIVAASLAGAGVAFSVSNNSSTAADLEQRAQQQSLQKQQLLTGRQSQVGEELRLAGAYQELSVKHRLLRQQANRVRARDPLLANVLEQEAQGLEALARATGAAFRAGSPQIGRDGTVRYDQEAALANLLAQDLNYQELHPEQTEREAADFREKALRLVGVGIVFAFSLFFLTLAQLSRPSRRLLFAGAGGLAILAGATLWALVEKGPL